MDLPQDFKDRMQRQLGDSYGAFLASYAKERAYGIRYNPLKIEKDKLVSFFEESHVNLEPVPWAQEGFYYPPHSQPGKWALHEAGAYYIQEPSAMSAVQALDPKPGERILDLCAAPGGKSTQIAGRMQGKGLLVANEIIPSRAKILSQNIERMGVTNALVCNETPQRLASRFPAFFDRILVDAPCSGEGMFRKDEHACKEWSLAQVAVCADRQRHILSYAAEMLKPGGILVYSTCTFAPEEDEENTSWFMQAFPQIQLQNQMRIWPHIHHGEGHYVAKFCKEGMQAAEKEEKEREKDQRKENKIEEKEREKKKNTLTLKKGKSNIAKENMDMLQQFFQQALEQNTAASFQKCIVSGGLQAFGEQLYIAAGAIGSLDGLKVERPGLQLGTCKKKRFEPSHALAMALRPSQVRQAIELCEPNRYLRGEAIPCSNAYHGWVLATVQGCSVGWGKAVNGMLKNHYPKGLRRELA